jgi:hypothetical protein
MNVYEEIRAPRKISIPAQGLEFVAPDRVGKLARTGAGKLLIDGRAAFSCFARFRCQAATLNREKALNRLMAVGKLEEVARDGL